MQARKKIAAIAAVLCCLAAAACSTTTGRKGLGPRPGSPEYYAELNSGEQKKPTPCSTWLNRGRAGGMVGSVIGFIVTSAIGTPVLGILYQVAGYAVGFAAADPCKKNGTTTQTAKSADSAANVHASVASAKITEEELQ